MPDDLYSDGPEAEMPAEAEAPPEEAAPEAEASEGPVGLLPKEVFGDKPLEVGSRCEIEIERVMDNQVQIKVLPHQYGDEAEPAPDAPADAEMAELMS